MSWRITLGERSAMLDDFPPELLAKAATASTQLGWRGVLYFPKSDPAAFRALVREIATEWGIAVPDTGTSSREFIEFQDAALEEVEDGDLPKSGTSKVSPSEEETTTGTPSTSTGPEDGDPT